MKNPAKIIPLALALSAFAGPEAFAGKYLASAHRTAPFSGDFPYGVAVPLTNDNAATSLAFITTAEQVVKITYNAECVVTGAKGKYVVINVLVDGIPAKPDTWVEGNFFFCSAVDATGKTWAPAVRQSVLKVPAGNHTVQVYASWGPFRLDDTSLVVEGSPRASATINEPVNYVNGSPYDLVLNNNDATTLKFTTTKDNQRVLATYNPSCGVPGGPSFTVQSFIHVEGVASPDNVSKLLCPSLPGVDTVAATAVQKVFKVPEAGDYLAGVLASAVNTTPWHVLASSLVIDTAIRASAWRNAGFQSSSTSEVVVPLDGNGSEVLKFKTTAADQPVIITYSASCSIAAPRGTFVSLRVVVDGVEASPKSGHDFAFCSAVKPGYFTYWPGFRQSTFAVRAPGEHQVRIYAKASATANWGLTGSWLVVR